MDPLNLEVIQAAVKTVNENTIPLLEAAFARQLAQATKDMTDVVDRANVQIANQVQGALIGFQAVADKAAKDLSVIVSRLDGATVTLHFLSPQQK
jgi:hypothetical protein